MKILVTDIDNTIADVRPRLRASLRAVGRPEVYGKSKDSYGGFKKFLEEGELNRFWSIFLSDRFLELDRPAPGAARSLKLLADRVDLFLYLTGRQDEEGDSMRPGTVEWLGEGGFPLPDGREVVLEMKPRREMDDFRFKREVLRRRIERLGGRREKILGVGIGDLPDDARAYGEAGLRPLLLTWPGLFEEEILISATVDTVLASDWTEARRMVREFFARSP